MKTHSRYENPTFARQLADFPIIDNRAMIAQHSGLVELEGYKRVGNVEGRVVDLATGKQSLMIAPDMMLNMRLYGSGNGTMVGHHFTYEHGNIGRDTKVMIDHNCPAGHLDIDCGCRHTTGHALQEVFGEGGDSGLYINIDTAIPSGDRIQVANDILQATHGINSAYIQSTPSFDQGCEMSEIIHHGGKKLDSYKDDQGNEFVWTHDMNVTYLGGNKGRLLVIKELAREDVHGFAGKQKLHQVLLTGDVTSKDNPPLVRPHSSCTTAEYGGNLCDCEFQQHRTQQAIAELGVGAIVHLEDEGMGTGFMNKLWQTQHTAPGYVDLLTSREQYLGLPGDIRTYSVLSFIRQITGISHAIHASNNHTKRTALENAGIEVVGQMALKTSGLQFSASARADFIAKQRSGRYSDYLNY